MLTLLSPFLALITFLRPQAIAFVDTIALLCFGAWSSFFLQMCPLTEKRVYLTLPISRRRLSAAPRACLSHTPVHRTASPRFYRTPLPCHMRAQVQRSIA
jgi:hypothetical protein